MKNRFFGVFGVALVLFLLSGFLAVQTAATEEDIPPELMKWKNWVLHGKKDRLCPPAFNDGNFVFCRWPSRLVLGVNDNGGRFEQEWVAFSETYLPVPGSKESWPVAVKVNGLAAAVVERNGSPHVFSEKGVIRVKGQFQWNKMPETLMIPPQSGLVQLIVNEKPVSFPSWEKNGQLWLKKRKKKGKKEESDRLEVRIFRLLHDSIPMRIKSRIQLDVSGRQREVEIDNILLEQTIPMDIDSPLPIRIAQNGVLNIQVRPGRWSLEIKTRLEGPVSQTGPVVASHGPEIWSFKPENDLRMVRITGVPAIEPARTEIPDNWKQYDAYLMEPGATMRFEVLRRGDPEPAPDRLTLQRDLWLDFDGTGYTVKDRINGTVGRHWRLEMNPPANLGRVSVQGEDRLITSMENSEKAGVEIRHGKLEMTAVSRYPDSLTRLPAVGWDHDFRSVSGDLHIPPGWRLLSVGGVDHMSGTWFKRWSLLDIFIVLIIAIAVFKLKSIGWGIVAFFTMALIYHEPLAPRYVWLNILVAFALLGVLPKGWIRKLVALWGIGAAVCLISFSLPFMVHQVRTALYPQLDWPSTSMAGLYRPASPSYLSQNIPEEAVPRKSYQQKTKSAQILRNDRYTQKKIAPRVFLKHDPNALVQTGPGLPKWRWRNYRMKWNGPVDKNQRIRLWLISPVFNKLLAVSRVILLAIFIFGVLDIRKRWQQADSKYNGASAAILFALLVPFTANLAHSAQTGSTGYPPSEMLEKLEKRLLEKPDCLPDCATINRIDLNAGSDSLRILLDIHAMAKTAAPLPGSVTTWNPDSVILNEGPAGLYRDSSQNLWILVPKGVHKVVMTGGIKPVDSLSLSFPLKPMRGSYTVSGWKLQGIYENGQVDSGIRLTRNSTRPKIRPDGKKTLEVPPFFHVKRTLRLGIEWQVQTTVTRLTPPDNPVVETVPLLTGESVTTEGIRVKNHRALVGMQPSQTRISWTSSLDKSETIELKAPVNVPWTETWELAASPVWHVTFEGLVRIHHRDRQGNWQPRWRPWPGESVRLIVSRPKAVAGQIVTIDAVSLDLTPGQRFEKGVLKTSFRTSRGVQHEFVLPENARLERVKYEDKVQPVRQEGRRVVVPLQPGSRNVELSFRQPANSNRLIKSPEIKIGEKAVNADIRFHMPSNRWILWTSGPTLGPAVLFWTYLAVVILFAAALGQISFSPLKTGQWLLLGLGLTQIHPLAAIAVAAWFIVLKLRREHHPPTHWFWFNLVQLIIIIFTVFVLFFLYQAVDKGLLGIPRMQIDGNGSTSSLLHWTTDRIDQTLPRPWVLSLPIFVFHLLMLFWALWLAIRLIGWLRWGWDCFSEGAPWKKPSFKKDKPKPPPLKKKTEESGNS